jgi:hypothetical protein
VTWQTRLPSESDAGRLIADFEVEVDESGIEPNSRITR